MHPTENPTGLKGFAFLEFSAPSSDFLNHRFEQLGFSKIAHHPSEALSLYQQGEIFFVLNASDNPQVHAHRTQHGAGASAMGFQVDNAALAYDYVLKQGAKPFTDGCYDFPAIEGIGGSVIYLIDKSPFSDWSKEPIQPTITGAGLQTIDHLTHNVYRGHMDEWADFYIRLFNFKEIRFFDIVGQSTGLISRAMASPTGEIKIPLNESKDATSQIEEFLHEYQGEGIQHIALSTNNIYSTVDALRSADIHFLTVPDTYYEVINTRIPWHQESIPALQERKILIDGESNPSSGLLLQIFTQNLMGPAFFEIIQRKGNQGFGEGNFQALFEAIERDQVRRGIL